MRRPGAPSTRERGLAAEEEAVRFLESRGLVVCQRNVHAGGAELDIIAELKPSGEGEPLTIVIVEVRSREGDESGSPLETVDRRKQAQIRRGATAWLVERGLWERVAVRFDVIGIVLHGEAPRIQWIPGAFEVDGS